MSKSMADLARENLDAAGNNPDLSLADLARVAYDGASTLSLADLAYAQISA